MFLPFVRGHYGTEDSRDLPKTKLLMWARGNNVTTSFEIVGQIIELVLS